MLPAVWVVRRGGGVAPLRCALAAGVVARRHALLVAGGVSPASNAAGRQERRGGRDSPPRTRVPSASPRNGARPQSASFVATTTPSAASVAALVQQGVAAFAADAAAPLQRLPAGAWDAASAATLSALRDVLMAVLERTPGPSGRRRRAFTPPELAALADAAVKRRVADGTLLTTIGDILRAAGAPRLGAIDLSRLLYALARAVDTGLVPSAAALGPCVAWLEAQLPGQALHLDLAGTCSIARSLHALGSRNMASYATLSNRMLSLIRAGMGGAGEGRAARGGASTTTFAYALTAFAAVNMRSMRYVQVHGTGYALCTPFEEGLLIDHVLTMLPVASGHDLCTLAKAMGTLGIVAAEVGHGSATQRAIATLLSASATSSSHAAPATGSALAPTPAEAGRHCRVPVADALWDAIESRAAVLLPHLPPPSLSMLAASFARASRLLNAELGAAPMAAAVTAGDNVTITCVVGSDALWSALHAGITANLATLSLFQLSHAAWAFTRVAAATDALLHAISTRVARMLLESTHGGSPLVVEGDTVAAAANLVASYAQQPPAVTSQPLHSDMLTQLLSAVARGIFESAAAAEGGEASMLQPSLAPGDLSLLLWCSYQLCGLLGKKLPVGTPITLSSADDSEVGGGGAVDGAAIAVGRLKGLLAALADVHAPVLAGIGAGGAGGEAGAVLAAYLRSVEQLTVSIALHVASLTPEALTAFPVDSVMRLLLCFMAARHHWPLFVHARKHRDLPAGACPLPSASLVAPDDTMLPDPELGVVDTAAAALKATLRARGVPVEQERRHLQQIAQGRAYRRTLLPALALDAASSPSMHRGPGGDDGGDATGSGMRAALNAWRLR